MKVGFIQWDVQRELDANLETVWRHLEDKDWDLTVLPELCLGGYLFPDKTALERIAQPVPQGEGVQRMADLSRKQGGALLFGLAEKGEDGKIYNTAVLVDEGQYVGKYRKIHLSDWEKQFFAPGENNPVFSLRGWTIGVEICIDLWFPEVARQQIRQGARLLCALGNFGGRQSWLLAQARALENGTPLVLCNRVGQESLPQIQANFLGKSMVCAPFGQLLADGKEGAEDAQGAWVEQSPRGNVIFRDLEEEIARHYESK